MLRVLILLPPSPSSSSGKLDSWLDGRLAVAIMCRYKEENVIESWAVTHCYTET